MLCIWSCWGKRSRLESNDLDWRQMSICEKCTIIYWLYMIFLFKLYNPQGFNPLWSYDFSRRIVYFPQKTCLLSLLRSYILCHDRKLSVKRSTNSTKWSFAFSFRIVHYQWIDLLSAKSFTISFKIVYFQPWSYFQQLTKIKITWFLLLERLRNFHLLVGLSLQYIPNRLPMVLVHKWKN